MSRGKSTSRWRATTTQTPHSQTVPPPMALRSPSAGARHVGHDWPASRHGACMHAHAPHQMRSLCNPPPTPHPPSPLPSPAGRSCQAPLSCSSWTGMMDQLANLPCHWSLRRVKRNACSRWCSTTRAPDDLPPRPPSPTPRTRWPLRRVAQRRHLCRLSPRLLLRHRPRHRP